MSGCELLHAESLVFGSGSFGCGSFGSFDDGAGEQESRT